MNAHVYFSEYDLIHASYRQNIIAICSQFDTQRLSEILFDGEFPFINICLKPDVNYNEFFELVGFHLKPYKIVFNK